MSKLKVSWHIPKVAFNGRGIGEAWGLAMQEVMDWTITEDQDADVIFLMSDSQLNPEVFEMGKPVVCFFWGYPPHRFLEARMRDDKEYFTWLNQQLSFLAKCERVLVPSPTTMDQAMMLGIENLHLCVAGVDNDLLTTPGDYGARKNNEVLFLSRLASYKGIEDTIIACAHIDPSPNLVVMGPGDNTKYVEMAKQHGVNATFTEATDPEKVKALRECSVLCHFSSYEGFGLPPLEALFVGTPVVAFDSPQLRWLLREHAFFAGTIPELAHQLASVLGDQNKALAVARGGLDYVRSEMTLAHAARRLTDHLHLAVKADLGRRVREHPDAEQMSEIYDIEHRRNYDTPFGFSTRFDPTWARHWRAEAFVSELTKGGAKTVVDIGCGPVYPTIFARAGFEVTAVDIAPECLRQVHEIAEQWGVDSHITTIQAAAQDLPLDTESVDAAMLGEILEHVYDPEVLLEEAFRVIKPGGRVIMSTPIGHHHYDPMHIASEEGGWDEAGMRALMEGYEVERLDTIAESGDPSCFLAVVRKPSVK